MLLRSSVHRGDRCADHGILRRAMYYSGGGYRGEHEYREEADYESGRPHNGDDA